MAAARYDRLDYKFDNHLLPGAFTGAPDATDHFDHFTPKLGLTYDFGKNKGAYINYSVGFAPPNITDLYTGVKVPVLKASSYNNYEVGGWVSFAANKGYAEVSLYKLDGENEIVSVRLADGSYQNQNAGKQATKALKLNIKYAPVEELAFGLLALMQSINILITSSKAKTIQDIKWHRLHLLFIMAKSLTNHIT